MSLALIGIGLHDERDISLKGLDLCKHADRIYLEHYTSRLHTPIQRLESLYGKKITIADRALIEHHADTILNEASEHAVCVLIIGDVFTATTHTDLYLRAKERAIEVTVVHNASIFTAVGATGLQVYKFGKTTSIPFTHHAVDTPYIYLQQNRSIGAHTLFLLDLDVAAEPYLTIREALDYLHHQEQKHRAGLIRHDEHFIACARLGANDAIIAYGTKEQLARIDFGEAPYCLILPGQLHFLEEEFLEQYRI